MKLSADNYLIWKSQFLTAIKAYRLQYMLDGSQIAPAQFLMIAEAESVPNPSFLDWEMLEKQLLSCILASVTTESVLPYILNQAACL